MSDNRKEAEQKMAKAIFISGDGWLAVFDLLAPAQLGLGISMISHRFNFYVDVHFRTRKWALRFIRIRSKIDENGTSGMEIANFLGKPMPIVQIQLPRKVIAFKCIIISFIDNNAIAFLQRFGPIFASGCPINLAINTDNDRILELILHNIWPIIAKNICGIYLFEDVFHRLRTLMPSILNDLPLLRVVKCHPVHEFFTEFPANDNAMASDGQALAKWLFTPHPNNVPKVFKGGMQIYDLLTKIEEFKTPFANASSPANFIVVIWLLAFSANSVVLFCLTNELTGEQLMLKRTDYSSRCFLLIRCPIVRDADKWSKWEKEAIGWEFIDQWNQIDVQTNDEKAIGDGLLDDATLGPSDQQQKSE